MIETVTLEALLIRRMNINLRLGRPEEGGWDEDKLALQD